MVQYRGRAGLVFVVRARQVLRQLYRAGVASQQGHAHEIGALLTLCPSATAAAFTPPPRPIFHHACSRVVRYRVEDGLYDGCIAEELLDPMDVEECEGGAWLVSCRMSGQVLYLPSPAQASASDGSSSNASPDVYNSATCVLQVPTPVGLALDPGWGLVLRTESSDGTLQVFVANTHANCSPPPP